MPSNIFRKGQKVMLKPLSTDYYFTINKWLNDPELTNTLSRTLPITDHEQIASIAHVIKSQTHYAFSIHDLNDNLLGITSIYDISWPDRRGKIGLIIGDKKHWGEGFAGEAAMLLLDFAFNSLDLFLVATVAASNNERAIEINRRAGFEEVGRLPHWIRAQDGHRVDEIIFTMTQEHWRPMWNIYAETGKYFSNN